MGPGELVSFCGSRCMQTRVDSRSPAHTPGVYSRLPSAMPPGGNSPACLPPPAYRHYFLWVGPKYKYLGNIQFCLSPFGETLVMARAELHNSSGAHHHWEGWLSPGHAFRVPIFPAGCWVSPWRCPLQSQESRPHPSLAEGTISCLRSRAACRLLLHANV